MRSIVGATLARYLCVAFARTILFVFAVMFALIYVIDFVELVRRSGDAVGGGPGTMALLSLLRVPSVAEQVLPFSVLFGSMAALLNLSRKLELVVARAAGMSVWQFLAPPLAVAVLIGVFATAVYNPLAANFKQRADAIETRLFSRGVASADDTSLWIRQKSVDGQAILRAEKSSDFGTNLSGVTAFVYAPDGSFEERVEAVRATLWPGFWALDDVRVLTPGEPPQDAASYDLATNLTAAQVTQSFVPPDSVPFWTLPEVRDRTERAGLDATQYRLRYQLLLAKPLLFAAMVLVAAAFSLRFFRFGGIARMVTGGVTSGFVLYVAQKLVGDLGGAGLLSAPIAAWSPAVVGSMLGTLALLHQEDG